jgi:histidinol-phosphate aminotransferase
MKFFPEFRNQFSGYQSALKPKDVVRLNANEGRVLNAYREYPLKRNEDILEQFADLYGVEKKNLIADRGVDGILELIFLVFNSPGTRVLTSSPTYGMYKILADIYGQEYCEVPLKDNGSLDTDFLKQSQQPGQIIIICRPNNPTGDICPKEQIVEVLEASQGKSLVVLDEAYADYLESKEQGLDLLNHYQNLLICRTLSKFYSLAGLRVGFGIANSDLVKKLIPYQSPYPIPSIVSDWLVQNFNQEFIVNANIENQKILKEKITLKNSLSRFGKVKIAKANFVNLYASNAKTIYEKLKLNNVEVRLFDQLNFLRFSIGTDKEMERLYNSLESLL